MRSTLNTAAALLLLAACNSSPTGGSILTARISDDVATVAADATAEDVDLMVGMNGLPGNMLFMTPPVGMTNGCGFGGGRFTCPPNSANGLTSTRTVAFFDAGGAAQQGYDPALTARIEVQMRIQGDVTRGPWSATIDRSRDMTFTGLLGAETTRTANGTATGQASRVRVKDGQDTRSHEMSETATIVDVVIPVRGEGVAPWPLSGTITRIVTITTDGGTPVTRTVIITFNGTATPPATVNGEPFTIDLANRKAMRR